MKNLLRMRVNFPAFLILVLLLVLSANKLHSANDNQLITQLKVVDNDSTFLHTYVYDAGNKVLETVYFQQDSTTFIRKTLTEWIYDGANCITQRERIWNKSSWDFAYTIDYTYANNILTNEVHSTYLNGLPNQVKNITFEYNQNVLKTKREYSKLANSWHLSILTNYSYLPNNKTDSIIVNAFQADTLSGSYLSTFNYDNSGLLVSQLQQQRNDTVWLNTDSINWFYFKNSNRIQTQKNKKWNTINSNWDNFQRIDYQYNDSNQVTTESYQKWNSQFWQNDIRYDYTYDNNHILLKKTLSLPIYSDWRSTVSINYSDFTLKSANTIKSTFEFWGGNTGQLTTSFIPFMFNNELVVKRASSIQIGYIQFNDTILASTKTPKNNIIQAYPNPSNGIFYLNSHEYGVNSWLVSDINGRVIKKEERVNQTGIIDLTDLPKGIYLIRIMTNQTQFFQKLIKE